MGIPFLKNLAAPLISQGTQQLNSALSNVGSAIGSATQAFTNFDFAGAGQKTVEAAKKLIGGGTLGNFSALSKDTALSKVNDVIAAVDKAGSFSIPIATSPNTITQRWMFDGDISDSDSNIKKVILSGSPGGAFSGPDDIDVIVLAVMPRISENRSADYTTPDIVHHPGQIQKYKSTAAREWRVSARLISRTTAEADINRKYINLIRSWVMPFYGEGTANSAAKKWLGAPPPIITLSAYGELMIGPVKTVLKSYDWEFPNDVDYIPTSDKSPFPVILDISLSFTEAWSPAEYSGFDIVAYRNGELGGDQKAFKAISKSTAPQTPGQPAAGVAANSTANEAVSTPDSVGSDPTRSIIGALNEEDSNAAISSAVSNAKLQSNISNFMRGAGG